MRRLLRPAVPDTDLGVLRASPACPTSCPRRGRAMAGRAVAVRGWLGLRAMRVSAARDTLTGRAAGLLTLPLTLPSPHGAPQAPPPKPRRKPPIAEPEVILEVEAPEKVISATAPPEDTDWWHSLGVMCVVAMYDGGNPGFMSCNMAPPSYAGGEKISLLAFQVGPPAAALSLC